MFGSIMRGRVKPAKREEFERLMVELSLAHVARHVGLQSVELASEAEDANRVVMILHFADRETYERNADDPQTQANYQRWSELLEAEPNWIDIAFTDYVGHPLTETVAASGR